MSHSISQLLAAWSDVNARPDPSNLRGLLQALLNLQEHPDDAHAKSEIVNGAASLDRSFEQAFFETETDAKRLPDYSPLLEMYDFTLSSYTLAREVLDRIRQERQALHPENLNGVIHDLEDALDEMEQDQEQWAEWMKGGQPRCARCGYDSNRETRCKQCKIDLLIPDSRGPESNNRGQAVLGPEYVGAYHAYGRLQAGEIGLSQFFQACVPLQKSVRHWEGLLRQGGLQELEPGLRQAITSCIEQSVQGLWTLESSHKTREWRDINEGWDTLFNAAVDMQTELPSLHRALGDEETARTLEQNYRVRDTA